MCLNTLFRVRKCSRTIQIGFLAREGYVSIGPDKFKCVQSVSLESENTLGPSKLGFKLVKVMFA